MYYNHRNTADENVWTDHLQKLSFFKSEEEGIPVDCDAALWPESEGQLSTSMAKHW